MIKVRKYKSKFTGKVLYKGELIDTFTCREEWTDLRLQILAKGEFENYSFIFDFDEESREYKMSDNGEWGDKFPEYEDPMLEMSILIAQLIRANDSDSPEYRECY